ncbi:MAG TPA: glycosyltransferase family 2 protein [Acidimicrobiales bacterium]
MTDATGVLDVEISIVNHDNCALTRACLRSLPSACEGLDWHVTLVDNASTDGCAGRLRAEFPHLAVLANQTRHGFGVNQNKVIGPAVDSRTARYVLVLNNDTELGAGSVTALVKHGDDHAALGVIGPRTYNADWSVQPSSFRFPTACGALLSDVYPRAAPLGCVPADTGRRWLGGACLLLRTDALRDVGCFDPRFFLFFEDIDLAHRMWDAGWESAICPDASIMHHNHKTVEMDGLKFDMACQLRRSFHLYMAKYHGQATAVALTCLGRLSLLIRALIRAMYARLKSDHTAMSEAAFLRQLAAYDPTNVLAHEVSSS